MTIYEAAEYLGLSAQRVLVLARQDRFPGATRTPKTIPNGFIWTIPARSVYSFRRRGAGRPRKVMT